eukprot:8222884-Alexandrium_andersonii.AAC.1
MSTSKICWALQPDLQWEKCMHFHVFAAQDLKPFADLNFANGMAGTSTQEASGGVDGSMHAGEPLQAPQDR